MKNFYSSRCPKLYLHIKPNNQKAAGLAELLWPHVELLLLNYTLAVCHWLSLRDITRNSPIKIASVGILLIISTVSPHQAFDENQWRNFPWLLVPAEACSS